MSFRNLEEYEELSDDDKNKVEYMIEELGYSKEEAFKDYEDVEYYPGMTLRELAEQFVDEGLFGNIDESLLFYIDYDAIARDLAADYDEQPDGIYRVR